MTEQAKSLSPRPFSAFTREQHQKIAERRHVPIGVTRDIAILALSGEGVFQGEPNMLRDVLLRSELRLSSSVLIRRLVDNQQRSLLVAVPFNYHQFHTEESDLRYLSTLFGGQWQVDSEINVSSHFSPQEGLNMSVERINLSGGEIQYHAIRRQREPLLRELAQVCAKGKVKLDL